MCEGKVVAKGMLTKSIVPPPTEQGRDEGGGKSKL
jgi:hypothetical protein